MCAGTFTSSHSRANRYATTVSVTVMMILTGGVHLPFRFRDFGGVLTALVRDYAVQRFFVFFSVNFYHFSYAFHHLCHIIVTYKSGMSW